MLAPTKYKAHHKLKFDYPAMIAPKEVESTVLCLGCCSERVFLGLSLVAEKGNSALFACANRSCSNKLVKIDFSQGEPQV